MKVNHRLLYWGVFLVAAGAVMLLAQGDRFDAVIEQALPLWPVAVIALGVGLLLRHTRFGLAGGMVAAAMPGLLLGGLVAAGPRLSSECIDVRPATVSTREGVLGSAASVDLRFACGDLSVTTAPGTGWRLEAGNGTGSDASIDASADRLSIASATRGLRFDFARGRDTWRLSLPQASTLDLSADISAGHGRLELAGARLGSARFVVNAGDTSIDLGGATVGRLSVEVNAASASLSLPDGDLVVDTAVNAGALRICAPAGLGLRIRHQGVLDATTIAGLVRAGDAWETPGYATAIHHADVTATVNVGSVDVNPVGGCR